MAQYVFAFRSSPDRESPAGEDQAWASWFASLGPAISDAGHRVGDVTRLAAANGGNGAEVLSGYVVITADDMPAAVTAARGCPGLTDGVSVEVAATVEM